MARKRNRETVIENGLVTVDPRMSGLKAAFESASNDLTTGVNPALKSVGTLAIVGAALYLLAQLPQTSEFEPFDENDDDEFDEE